MSKKVYRVRAKALDREGRGVVLFNHSMIPVPGLLPGELAAITLYRRREETLGRIEELLEPSADRRAEVCPHFGRCGGCQLWHMSDSAQLEYKQAQVSELMGNVCPVPPVLGMDTPTGYRHKIHATFGRDARGRIIAGIYQEGSHRLLPVKDCAIQAPVANQIINAVRRGMEDLKIQPYDEDRRYGLLRHVLIRVGHKTGQLMVVLVVASFKFPQGKALCERLLRAFPQIRTIVYNLNAQKTSMVLGNEQKIVYGDGCIEDELCGLTFRISPKSFYQVNPAQTEVLYKKAMEMAQISETDRVLDTYCGTGTISLIAAGYAGEVTGVELSSDAVADAAANARKNRIENVRFVCEDATKYMERMAVDFKNKSYYNVVIMDPPRSGSTLGFLKALTRLAPERVVYISCNPVTQKRDMEILLRRGYRAVLIQPVDMFPMTAGIENIVLFKRRTEASSEKAFIHI